MYPEQPTFLSRIRKLFHICDHRWTEVRRTKIRGYYNHPSISGGIPDEVRFVIELKCSKCGDIKFKKIKL